MKAKNDPLPPSTRKVLKRLGKPLAALGFTLAGGTGLAIHLRHRISEDLDFFGRIYHAEKIRALVRQAARSIEILQDTDGTFTAIVDGTKVSMFRYAYPFMEKSTEVLGAAVADPLDISSMKFIAVRQRGLKKDFVDLYKICHAFPMPSLAENLVRRFGMARNVRSGAGASLNPVDIGKSLTYFTDADEDPDVIWLAGQEVPWKKIKSWFERSAKQIVREINAILSEQPDDATSATD